MANKPDTFDYQKFDVIRYIPTSQSSGEQWKQWFDMLDGRFGRKTAQYIWLKAWIMRAGKGSSASTTALRDYMRKKGVQVEATTLESLGVGFEGIGDFIGGIFTGLKWFVIITSVGGAALIGFLIYKAAKNPKQTAQLVGSVTPAGRAVAVGSKVASIKK